MFKVLVYMQYPGMKNVEAGCYVFSFNTLNAANFAKDFFVKCGCNAEAIYDESDRYK